MKDHALTYLICRVEILMRLTQPSRCVPEVGVSDQ
jgi:hypothetical protein